MTFHTFYFRREHCRTNYKSVKYDVKTGTLYRTDFNVA